MRDAIFQLRFRRIAPDTPRRVRILGFCLYGAQFWTQAREAQRRAVELPDDYLPIITLGREELEAAGSNAHFMNWNFPGQPVAAEARFLIQVANGYVAMERLADAAQVLDS